MYSPIENARVKWKGSAPSHQPLALATARMLSEKRNSSPGANGISASTNALATTTAWSRGTRCAAQIAPPVALLSASTWKIHCSIGSATRSDSPPTIAPSPTKPYWRARLPISSTAARAVVVRSAARRESSFIVRSAGPPSESGAA